MPKCTYALDGLGFVRWARSYDIVLWSYFVLAPLRNRWDTKVRKARNKQTNTNYTADWPVQQCGLTSVGMRLLWWKRARFGTSFNLDLVRTGSCFVPLCLIKGTRQSAGNELFACWWRPIISPCLMTKVLGCGCCFSSRHRELDFKYQFLLHYSKTTDWPRVSNRLVFHGPLLALWE